MELLLSLWNIHDWLEERGVEHSCNLEDDLPLFAGIRFRMPEVDQESYAILYDISENTQHSSVLSFKNSRIYFRCLKAADAMNLLNDIIYAYTDWHRKLMSANLAHTTLDELLAISASMLHLPLIVLKNMKIEGCSENTVQLSCRYPEEKLSDLTFVRSCCKTLKNAQSSNGSLILYTPEYGNLMMVRILCQSNYALLFARAGERKITQADLLLFSRIRHAVSIHLKNRDASAESYNASLRLTLSSLAEGTFPSEKFQQCLAKKLNWRNEDTFQVSCLQYRDTALQQYPDLLYPLLRNCFPGSCPLAVEDCIFLFVNVSQSSQIPDESVFSGLLPTELLYIGQSNPHIGISNLAFLIRQAEQALIIARQTGKTFVNAQTISTQAVLRQFYSDNSLQAMVHPAIILLRELDNENKAGYSYLETLEVYLTSGTNISAAARELRLHRNTLVNRIDRIKELTGLTLIDPKELETLRLSLIIYNRNRAD